MPLRAVLDALDAFTDGRPAHDDRTTDDRGGNAMLGQMQDWPLLIHRIIDHAATYHGGRCVVSRSIEGPIHTTTYADIRRRASTAGVRGRSP